MGSLPLCSLPLDTLRARAIEVVRSHWVAPLPAEAPEPMQAGRLDEMARAALDTMLTRQFRVGPLPPPEVHAVLLKRVRKFVRRGRPIKVTLGYGPLKNQHALPYSRADWAEFFALCHLVAWHNKVQAVYPPGLEIQIVFDDSTLLMANRADRGLMASYMASISELVRALRFEAVFLPSFAQSSFSWLFHLGPYQVARFRVWRWERNHANRVHLERMNAFARRNVMVPTGLDPLEQDRFVRAAAHRYRVYWEALQLSSIFWGRLKLVAMYLDGSQHHAPQAVALHLTTVDKGQITQPWQGEGALLDNGHGKLVPFVLTAGRRARHTAQVVDGLDVVGRPGFERIAVVTPAMGAPVLPEGAPGAIDAEAATSA